MSSRSDVIEWLRAASVNKKNSVEDQSIYTRAAEALEAKPDILNVRFEMLLAGTEVALLTDKDTGVHFIKIGTSKTVAIAPRKLETDLMVLLNKVLSLIDK